MKTLFEIIESEAKVPEPRIYTLEPMTEAGDRGCCQILMRHEAD